MASSYNNAQRLPQGIGVNVCRAKGEEISHNPIEHQWLRNLIEGDAKAHGAIVSESSFNKVVNAICAKKIQACFLTVAWDDGEPQYAGGAIEIPSILTEWTGNGFAHYPAVYSEDTYVLPELSAKFRAKTKTDVSPNGRGLGTCFTQERIRLSVSGNPKDLSFGCVSRARISENSVDNIPMLNILKKLGATIEAKEGTILELNRSPTLATVRQDVLVTTENLCLVTNEKGLVPQSNVFLTCWAGDNGAQQIVASFTEAISTFTGKPVIRVQFTSNGFLPEIKNLEHVLDALLSAGRKEILRKGWLSNNRVAALFPNMRIHALNEPQIISTLKKMGANTRRLGSHPMVPVIANFTRIPDNVVHFEALPARPFITSNSIPMSAGLSPSGENFSQVSSPYNSTAVAAYVQ